MRKVLTQITLPLGLCALLMAIHIPYTFASRRSSDGKFYPYSERVCEEDAPTNHQIAPQGAVGDSVHEINRSRIDAATASLWQIQCDSKRSGSQKNLRSTGSSLPVVTNEQQPRVSNRLADYDPSFPRLLGMNIGAKDYDNPAYLRRLSKLNVVILGFYKNWRGTINRNATVRSVVRVLRKENPQLLVGQSTILSESYDNVLRYSPEADVIQKLNQEDWWVRDARGRKVQWTARYHAWQTNFTRWARPDARGQRFPQWLAQRNYRAFFSFKNGFDIWYSDNVSASIPVAGDWEDNGKIQEKTDPVVAEAYREGEANYWAAARRLDHGILIIGNADNNLGSPEYKHKLNGAFLEGLMGHSWSIDATRGWSSMMQHYHAVFHNLLPPKIVGFNVLGSTTDYRLLRFALTSCLMDNGYFSYSDRKVGYSSVPWFDEYNVRLGYPISKPQLLPWKHGVYRRIFQFGLALVNPTDRAETVTLPPNEWRHFFGAQDPAVNDGKVVARITLAPKDGVILIRNASAATRGARPNTVTKHVARSVAASGPLH